MLEMTTIITVSKEGILKEVRVKELNENELYKKCGYKKDNDFKKITTWEILMNEKKIKVELWGKDNGKANTENKYDFPPPADVKLLFGTCCLIGKSNNCHINLTKVLWNKIYEKLFGGFEDLNEESEEEDELNNIPIKLKTNDGYLKDGFVVDKDSDEEVESGDDNSEYSEKSEEEYEDVTEIEGENEEEQLNENNDIGSELSEEAYEYSDDE